MRRLYATIFICTVFLATPGQTKDINVESTINAATVYSNRANVTRTARIDIPAGAHNLVFQGLPISIFPDSLRVNGSSAAKVVFGALSHKRESFEDFVVPRERELNAMLKALQDNQKVYNAEKQALKTGEEFLKSLGKQAALRENENIAEINLNPERWGAIADSLSSKMEQNLKASLAIDLKIRDTNEKIRKIREELNGLRTGQKQTYLVTVPFESDAPSSLTVELTYQVPGAGWTPIYDARLNVTNGELALIQYANVYQRTGEDWNDVDLTLSTAQPSRGAGLPDLYPNWLSLGPNFAKRHSSGFADMAANVTGRAAAPAPQMEMMAVQLSAPMEAEQDAVMQGAEINTEGFVGEYKITGPATVRANGEQSKLLIGTFETENALQVQVKPQISTEAYLVAKTTLKGDSPVLPGQVNLFRDGAYIGQTHIDMLRPDDVTELAFGIDDNVTVKRNTRVDKRSESGLITKEAVLERQFVTEIKNLHKTAISLAVLETFPVSKDERIRVDIIKDKTTPGYESDLKNISGLARWITEIQPKQQVTVNVGWRVFWPKDENLNGL